jgi:hypothetical protein
MALQKEIWISDIQENLFANNLFMKQIGLDHSGYVSYKTVHIPQAGANPLVKKNRSVLPAVISDRTDDELTYSLNEYTSEPILITDLDELQISYNKRQSVLKQHIDKLSNAIANNTLYTWAQTPAAITTTGSAVGTALAPSATGNRKAITLADIRTAAKALDEQDVDPSDSRYLVLPSALYYQLIGDSNISKYLEFGQATAQSGKVPMLMGFNIVVRSSAIVYDGSSVIKTVGDEGVPTSPTTTDNLGALAISSSYVTKAMGEIKVFADTDKPEYYGSIFSALVMHGASKMRKDGKGVVSIVQTT